MNVFLFKRVTETHGKVTTEFRAAAGPDLASVRNAVPFDLSWDCVGGSENVACYTETRDADKPGEVRAFLEWLQKDSPFSICEETAGYEFNEWRPTDLPTEKILEMAPNPTEP